MSESERVVRLAQECRRESENCLYTSTAMFEWLKGLRRWRTGFRVVGAVAGFAAAAPLLVDHLPIIWSIACGFIAGLAPLIYSETGIGDRLDRLNRLAPEFKNLQDRFRQLADLGPTRTVDRFDSDLAWIMERLEGIRRDSLAVPDKWLEIARKKIQESGHYDFDADERPEDRADDKTAPNSD